MFFMERERTEAKNLLNLAASQYLFSSARGVRQSQFAGLCGAYSQSSLNEVPHSARARQADCNVQKGSRVYVGQHAYETGKRVFKFMSEHDRLPLRKYKTRVSRESIEKMLEWIYAHYTLGFKGGGTRSFVVGGVAVKMPYLLRHQTKSDLWKQFREDYPPLSGEPA